MEQPEGNPQPVGFLKTRKGRIVVATAVLGLLAGGGLFFGLKKGKHAAETAAHSADEHEQAETKEHADAGEHGEAKQADAGEHGEAEAHGPAKKGLLASYAAAWRSVQAKVDELARASEENERLRLENENLRTQLATARFEARGERAERKTASVSHRLRAETWQEAGLKLDAIDYQIPAHLLPSQLYTLGVSYLRNGEVEKAAKIFTRLTSLEDESTYRTARHFLLTGVTWYRLDHLQLADAYFEKVLEFGEEPAQRPYLAQARLWRALVAERTSHHGKSQEWLLELVDHHPRSPEAAWVNRAKEAKRARVPASQSKPAAGH